MELSIISVESIKPSLPVHNHKPFKLSLFDQLAPTSYSPLILFYPLKDTYPMIRTTHILNKLKTSLSKTLDPFYPLSGVVRDNLFISDYSQGVPFAEARVKGQLLDFLRESDQLEFLNQFLPKEPYCALADPLLPQLAVQASIFDCGGMALAFTFLNKLGDGITGGCFLKTWAAIASGSYSKVIQPNLTAASTMFPRLEPPPSSYESVLFKKGRLIVRRFVFDRDAITTLREKSKSDIVKDPSGVQALSAFLWKSEMAAYRRVHKSQKPSMLMQVKEFRGATKPPLSEHAIGDLIWLATSRVVETDMELSDLLVIMKEGLDRVNSEFLKRTNILEVLSGSAKTRNEDLHVFTCSDWSKFGFDDIDFGWGKPIWSALYGKASETSVPNLALLKDVAGKKGAMDAWVSLDEQVMSALENDAEFLTYASPGCPYLMT